MEGRTSSSTAQNGKEGPDMVMTDDWNSKVNDSGNGESASASDSWRGGDERGSINRSRSNHPDEVSLDSSSSNSAGKTLSSGSSDQDSTHQISSGPRSAPFQSSRGGSRRTEGGSAHSYSTSKNISQSHMPLPAGLAAAEASFDTQGPITKPASSGPIPLGRRSGSDSPTPLNSHLQQSASNSSTSESSNLATEILPPPPTLPYDHRYPPLAPKMDAEVGAVSNSGGIGPGGGQGSGSGSGNPKKRSAPTQIDKRIAASAPKGSLPLGIRIALGKEVPESEGKRNSKLAGSKSDNSRLGSVVDDRATSPSSSSSLADTNTALGLEDERNDTISGDMPSSSPFASGAGSAASSPAFHHQALPRLGSDVPAAAEGEDADISMSNYDQSSGGVEASNGYQGDADEAMEDASSRAGSSKTPSKPRQRPRRSGLTPSPTSKLPSGLTSEPGKRSARARNPQFSYYAPLELTRREQEKDVRREQGLPSATPEPTKPAFYVPDEKGIVDASPSPPLRLTPSLSGSSLKEEESSRLAGESSHFSNAGSAKRPRLVLKKKENGALPFATDLEADSGAAVGDDRETSSEGLVPASLAAAASEGGSALVRTSPMKPGLGMMGGFQGSTQVHVAGGRLDENRAPNNEFCETCKGIGHFICCDGCPRSFHFACVNPPLDIDELPASSNHSGDTETRGEEPWYCKVCQSNRRKPAKPAKGIFGHLLRHVENENPTLFSLPSDIRTFFKGVATATDGGYVNGRMIRGFRANKQGFVEERDPFKLKDSKSKPVLCYQCGESALPKGVPLDSASVLESPQDKGKGKEAEAVADEDALSDPSRDHPGWRKILSCDFCSLHWHLDCVTPPISGMPSMMRKWMCPNHAEHLQTSRRVPKASSQLQTVDLPIPTASNIGPGQTYRMRVRNDGDVDIIPDPLDDFFQDNGSGRALDPGWEDIVNSGRGGPRLRYRVPEKVVRTDFWMRIGADERTRMELNNLGGLFKPVESGWRPSSHQKSALDALADIAMTRIKADSMPDDEQRLPVSHRTIQAALGATVSDRSEGPLLNNESRPIPSHPPQEVGAPHPDQGALKIIAQRIPESQAPLSTDRVILEDLSEEEIKREEKKRQREMELDSNSSLTDLSEDEDDHPKRIKRLPIEGSSIHPNPVATDNPTNSALTVRELAEQARLRAGHLLSSNRNRFNTSSTESIGGISKDEIHQLRAVRDLMRNVGEKRLLEFLVEENLNSKS